MLRHLLSLRFLVALFAVGVMALASPPAEAKFVFNHNHPDLNWFTIETEHFFVHYPVSKKTREEGNEHYLTGEFAARKSAEVSEEMWGPMCEVFDYYLKEKVHIVLLNQSDQLEGFTIPSWDWVEISANVGGYFWRMRGRMEWFSDVLVHEFAHVVSLKANAPMSEAAFGIEIGGLYSNGKINADIGGEVTLSDGAPFWWSEGGAEYWSDETNYNWWSSSRDHNIRTTVLEDRLLTYDEWGTRIEKRDWGDGERGYQQGYSIALYFRERFGPDIYAQFALASGKRWHLEWEDVVKEVTGVEAETLYDDWAEFLRERYGEVQAAVEADGEVLGEELLHSRSEWDYRDPDARDKWLEQKERDREDAKEATGTWITEPRYSDEGELYGVNNRGQLKISWAPEGTFLPFSDTELNDPETSQKMADYKTSVGMAFGHGFDFVPGQQAVVFTGHEDYTYADKGGYLKALLKIRPEFDGYDWKQIWYWDIKEYERTEKGREYLSLEPGTVFGGVKKVPQGTFRPIPNTLRGADPAVSPDGSKIAYFEYTDGTLNLVTINLDGTEKKHLTNYADGTWMQRVDWSPDGTQLVFQMFHNFRYDLWTINADGSNLSPLTWDDVEELDAHWAKDGQIYFSADPTGIFNIFSMDPETKKVMQLTNVVSSAQLPFLTPTGNLLYVQFTAHGNKHMGLAKEEFLNRDVTELFGKPVEKEEYEAFAAFQEDLSHWAEHTRKYKSRKSLMTPYFVPMIRFGNDSLTNFGLQGGGQVYMQDFVEDHVLVSDILLGEDIDALVRYQYQGWHPTFMVLGRHGETKYDYGYANDLDENPETTTDQSIFEGRQVQQYNVGMAAMFYPISNTLTMMAAGQGVGYGFKGIGDTEYVPFKASYAAYGMLSYNTVRGEWSSANPRGGRAIDLTYTRGYTDMLYEAYNGVDIDDGEELDAYGYNSMGFRWTEQIPVMDRLNMLLNRPERDPTLQVDVQAGWIDRNVQYGDEFKAGGRHPYWWGSGAVQPNTQFAGYPASSLSGETIALLNVAYRFPVFTKLNRRIGPLYVYDLYAQVMATAGNLWSYRPPSDPSKYYNNRYDDQIAYDPADITRETPFVDYAYKNHVDPDSCADGQKAEFMSGCNLLYDIGAELRLSSALFGSNWNSFFRTAYGLQEIRGIGDVNGDDISSNTDSQMGDTFSNETEDYRLRFYLGLGTGW